MAHKIQFAFKRHKKLKLLKTIFKSIKRIQTLYRVRIEYKKFRNKQKKLRLLQKWFKRTLFKLHLKKSLAILKKKRLLVTKLASLQRMRTQKKKFNEISNAIVLINRIAKGFLARKKLKNIKFCKGLLTSGVIFEKAWKIIRRKWEKEAAIEIQRIYRGFLARKTRKKEVDHIKNFKFFLFFSKKTFFFFRKDRVENKAGLLISRIAKGHIVRSKKRHRVYAISKIKGFIKMKWLSTLFQNLRRAVRIIQVFFYFYQNFLF